MQVPSSLDPVVARDLMLNNIAVLTGLLSKDGIVLMANDASLRAAGVEASDVIGKPFIDTYWWAHSQETRDKLKDALIEAASGKTVCFDIEAQIAQGARIFIDFRLVPIVEKDGSVSYLVPSATDITSRKRMEKALRQNEKRFTSLVNSNIIGIATSSLSGAIIDANDAYFHMLGYTRAEWEIKPARWDLITPADQISKDWKHIEEARIKGYCTPYEKEYFHKDGKRIPVLIAYALFEDDQEGSLAICFVLDLKRTQDLTLALCEKEILIKEAHHRVKNNLNVVTSLLSLQARQIKDPASIAAFVESKNRIHSIALIHEKLYQSPNLASIAFDKYLQELLRAVLDTFRRPDLQIHTEVMANGVVLPLDTAVPCGLIINELVSNCLKHAFTGRAEGKIHIEISHDEGNYRLEVRDDGDGMDGPLDRADGSLGIQLITALTRQLGGKMSYAQENGTVFTMEFALKEHNSQPLHINGTTNSKVTPSPATV